MSKPVEIYMMYKHQHSQPNKSNTIGYKLNTDLIPKYIHYNKLNICYNFNMMSKIKDKANTEFS